MPGKDCCPSKNHFAKVTIVVEGRPNKFTWKCDHCNKHVMSGNFRAATARVHLAALQRNGLCSNLCDATDDAAESRRLEFRALIQKKDQKRQEKARKRKWQSTRLQEQEDAEVKILNKKKKKMLRQPKLQDLVKSNNSAAADLAVAKWAFAHNIPPNTMQGPFWKRMNAKLQCVAPSYSPMHPKKLVDVMLPLLRQEAEDQFKANMRHRKDVGRSLTGDGATKQHTPFINFLVNTPGKGTDLVDIVDCTEHMSAGGTKDAL